MTSESAEPQAAAASQEAPAIQIRAQYVRDVSFESPNGPLPLIGAQKAPTLGLQLNVRHRSLQNVGYEVILNLKAESKLDDKTIYLCEVDYAALIAVKEGSMATHNWAIFVAELQ